MTMKDDESKVAKSSALEQLLYQRKYNFQVQCKIVYNCEQILQSPEDNLSKLRELIKLYEDRKFNCSQKLRTMLLASLCVVFKDILPTYKIRIATEKERVQQSKRETRKLRLYEESLLIVYQKYIDLLRVILRAKKLKKDPLHIKCYTQINWSQNDRLSALRCACQIFEYCPQFNFAEDLLLTILPYLNSKKKEVVDVVVDSLRSVFDSDRSGDVSLLVCRMIHRFCRGVGYRLLPAVASVLSLVPIREVAEPEAEKRLTHKERMKLFSRKDRKRDKLQRKFEKEMAETKAVKSRDERLKINTLILNEILFVYFKVLKTTKNSELLSAVLKGLSVYAHLINVLYVESLLTILNEFMAKPSTSVRDSLSCVHTALCILTGHNVTSSLDTDPTRFYNHLYRLLGSMCGASVGLPLGGGTSTSKPVLTLGYGHLNTPAAVAAASMARRAKLTQHGNGDTVVSDNTSTTTNSSSGLQVQLEEAERLTNVILSCLDMLLVKRRREVSTNRVLAFVKRLAGAALAMSESACAGAMLVRLNHYLRLFPRCEVLFDNESEIGGAYQAEMDDPELCLPASASLWELHLLRLHYSPVVKTLSTSALDWEKQVKQHGSSYVPPLKSSAATVTKGYSLDKLMSCTPSECLDLLSSDNEVSKANNSVSGKRRFKTIAPSNWLKGLMSTHNISETCFDNPKRLKV